MNNTRFALQPSFDAAITLPRPVVEDGWVFVPATAGVEYDTMSIDGEITRQCSQAFRNVADALARVGATMAHVVRISYFVRDPEDWEACWPITRDWLGQAGPSATMIVAGLSDPRVKVEIEVTARLPD